MRNWKSALSHAGGGILLSCVLLWVVCARVNGSEPAGQTTQDSQTAAATPPNEIAVALKEIPVWEVANERTRQSFLRGEHAYIAKDKGRFPAAKYPQFTSDTPLYGTTSLTLPVKAAYRSGRLTLALDSSQKGGDYDLLYFDDNADGDLTNDKPRKPAQALDNLIQHFPFLKETFFEPVTVTFGFRAREAQALELLPCLRIYPGGEPQFRFIAARVHAGQLEIDGTSYQACVGYLDQIRGRFDEPITGLLLVPEGGEPAYWWGGDQLDATHRLGSRYYRFSCTPTGDKLTVRPYEGPLGMFEVGAGGRRVERLTMRGSLRSKDSAVAVGDGLQRGSPKPARRCQIPVGDYYPAFIDVELGKLHLSVSNNYMSNAQGQPRGRQPVAGIAIRADKPYVLDFSNKPVVVFEEPRAMDRLVRGTDIRVTAVLVDPVLDIMIRGLDDTTRTASQVIKMPDGKEQTYNRPFSLDPKVVIRRANGEIVAEGVMPFG